MDIFNIILDFLWSSDASLYSAGFIVAAVVAIGSAIGTAVGSSAILGALVKAGLSFALGAIFKKEPSVPSIGTAQDQNRKVSVPDPAGIKQLIYGQLRVGGNVVYHSTTDDNTDLNIVLAVAGHEVNDITEVWIDNRKLWDSTTGIESDFTGKATVEVNLGTSTQAALSGLVAADTAWTSSHRLRGIAHVWIQLNGDAEVYPQQPGAYNVVVKGKEVLNLDTSTTEYTTNPAYILYDYLTDTHLGMGLDASLIDSSSFVDAAAICDESVTLDAGGTESRYTCSAYFEVDALHRSFIEEVLNTCAGKLIWTGSQLKLVAGAFAASTHSLTAQDFVGPLSVTETLQRSERITEVRGRFIDPDNNYELTDYPTVFDTALANQYGETLVEVLDLPYTTSVTQAQRIAKIKLNQSQSPATVRVEVSFKNYDILVGDTIDITYDHLNWSNKLFTVTGVSMSPKGNHNITLLLRETSSAIYSWSASEEGTVSTNTSINAGSKYTVSAPSGLTVTSSSATAIEQPDGSFSAVAQVTWNVPANAYSKNTLVQYKDNGDSNWITAGRVTERTTNYVNIGPLPSGGSYDFRIRHENDFGLVSAFATNIAASISGPTSTTMSGHTVNVDGAGAVIQSDNYDAGIDGWAITGNGDAEFNDVTIRGNLGLDSVNGNFFTTLTGGDPTKGMYGVQADSVNEEISDLFSNSGPWYSTEVSYFSAAGSSGSATVANRTAGQVRGHFAVAITPLVATTSNINLRCVLQRKLGSGSWTDMREAASTSLGGGNFALARCDSTIYNSRPLVFSYSEQLTWATTADDIKFRLKLINDSKGSSSASDSWAVAASLGIMIGNV